MELIRVAALLVGLANLITAVLSKDPETTMKCGFISVGCFIGAGLGG